MSRNESRSDRLPTTALEEPLGTVYPGPGLSIALNGGQTMCVAIDPESRGNIIPGQLLQIPLPPDEEPKIDQPPGIPSKDSEEITHRELLVRVSEVEYESPGDVAEHRAVESHINPDSAANERRHRLLAAVEPVRTVLLNSTGETIEVVSTKRPQLPKPYTAAYRPQTEVVRGGLGVPKRGPMLGYLTLDGEWVPESQPLPIRLLSPPPGDNRESDLWQHMLLVGKSGRGKSQLAKSMMRQMVAHPVKTAGDPVPPAVVIIDPSGEYASLSEDPDPELHGAEDLSVFDGLPDDVPVGGHDDVRVWLPETENSQPPTAVDADRIGVPFELVEQHPSLILPFEMEEPTEIAAKNVIQEFFEVNLPELQANDFPNSYTGLVEWIQMHGGERSNDLASAFAIHGSSYDAMRRRFEASELRSVFSGAGEPFTDVLGDMISPGRVSVVDTSHIRDNEDEEQLILQSIIAEIAAANLGSTRGIGNVPTILAIDESHHFLQSPETVRDQYLVDKITGVAREGRGNQLGLFLTSQNPTDIADTVRKQISSKNTSWARI